MQPAPFEQIVSKVEQALAEYGEVNSPLKRVRENPSIVNGDLTGVTLCLETPDGDIVRMIISLYRRSK